jgi:4-hydroxy-2-oxoheptanedioate aldolase
MTDYTSKRLRRRLGNGDVLLGLNHHYPSSAVLESMGTGWDFVWIDCQHGLFAYDAALASVRVAQGMGLDTLLRVESSDFHLLGKYADMGSSAIMIQQVDDAAEAEAVVRALRYPPRGNRSFASRRLIDLVGVDYHLQEQPLIVTQIESRSAIDAVEEIVAVDGVDALFFGPDDLRLDLGIAYDASPLDNDELNAAMRRTAEVARAAGKFAGTPAGTPELVAAAADMGYQLIIGGSDAGFVRVTARERLEKLHAVLKDRGHQPSAPPEPSA